VAGDIDSSCDYIEKRQAGNTKSQAIAMKRYAAWPTSVSRKIKLPVKQ